MHRTEIHLAGFDDLLEEIRSSLRPRGRGSLPLTLPSIPSKLCKKRKTKITCGGTEKIKKLKRG
ncbi:hypothetical protein AKJ51_04005 [candidate division MSBL1 archaeon SCGC-AAA382A20]|uniref:Uncharacterized protein n=1 Tax=candidate division MSBL1 archaeon SCGC-AAA382A20 TaxID=1698280 RepID=A0A133VIF9_9EURY|nr:hypothetical protein AKJ51_04005 [candidate division MSBL1 archaeon SCGC-AAA382A20]